MSNYELTERGWQVESQRSLPLVYHGLKHGFVRLVNGLDDDSPTSLTPRSPHTQR